MLRRLGARRFDRAAVARVWGLWLFAILIVLVLGPIVAWAQSAAPSPAPTLIPPTAQTGVAGWDSAMAFIDKHLDTFVMVLLAFLGFKGWDKTTKEKARDYKIREKAEWAYHQVSKIARKTSMPYDDMVATALGMFIKFLDLAGYTVTEKDKEVAKAIWTQMHEEDTKKGVDAANLRTTRGGEGPPPTPVVSVAPGALQPANKTGADPVGDPPASHV